MYNSLGISLVSHKNFTSRKDVIENNSDIIEEEILDLKLEERLHVADTEIGKSLKEQLMYLYQLLDAYRTGAITPTA
jgi:fructose-1,6-bisphosphatase